MSSLINRLSIDNVFLVDALGALYTSTVLICMYAFVPALAGIPKNILLTLAVVAFGFALYSAGSHRAAVYKKRMLLILIAIANLGYISLTTYFVIVYIPTMHWLSKTHFILEILVVFALAAVEISIVLKTKNHDTPLPTK